MQQLERSARRLEEWVGRGRKVKGDVVDDVVEVEVEDMVEEKMKEDVKVVEDNVTGGGGGWPRTLLGGQLAAAIMDLPWDPADLAGPHPPNLEHPLPVPLEIPTWTLRCLMHRVHRKVVGEGRWVCADEGVIHQDKHLRVGGGGLQGNGGGNRKCPGGRRAKPPPPYDNGVKVFEWA